MQTVTIFQQDNVRPHFANITTDFFGPSESRCARFVTSGTVMGLSKIHLDRHYPNTNNHRQWKMALPE